MKALVFDLDDTLYNEADMEIASMYELKAVIS